MKRFAAGVLLAALFSLPSGARPAGPLKDQPFALVRTLQNVQERVALGSAPALRLQNKLLVHISTRFAGMPRAVWKLPKNAQAAVTYVLSGGRPDAVRGLSNSGYLEAPYDQLLKGALAFADGQREVALKLLEGADEGNLSEALSGHLALIKAVLTRNSDLKKARTYLDRARLLMPATLIEESALRRGIVLAGEDGDRDGFVEYSTSYLRRYNKSVYISDFQQNFARMAIALEFAAVPDADNRLKELASHLRVAERRRLYLEIARMAVVKGASGLAQFSARQATLLADKSTPDHLRAMAYEAAAGVVTDRREQALKTLQSMDISRLSPEDRALVAAAQKLASEVTRLPPPMPPRHATPHRDQAAPRDMAAMGGADGTTVLARAEKLFGDVDALVEKAGK